MGLYYESQAFGEVRAATINGEAGIGASILRFVLNWNLFPASDKTYTVFGTSIWMSASPEGEAVPTVLGHAVPESAWCEESRDGQPYDRPVMYRLTLSTPRLLALEQLRQGRALTFAFDVRGNCEGPRGIRAIHETLRLVVNASEWARVLKEASAAEILLVGVQLPLSDLGAAPRSAIVLVRKAHEHLLFGEYTAAVAECRRAIESLWKSTKVVDDAKVARRLLATMKEQVLMTKRQRELAIGEAVRVFCHVAHHVGDNAEPEVFGRTDAALVVASTAALISSLAATTARPASRSSHLLKESATTNDQPTDSNDGTATADRTAAALFARASDHLRERPANRPRTLKGLRSVLHSLFREKLGQRQLDSLIDDLKRNKVIAEVGGKLAYPDTTS